jgi:hypothetical protein
MHWGWPGRWLRRGVQLVGRGAVRTAGVQVKNPDSLMFVPEVLEHGIGRWTERISKRLDYDRIAARRRANFEWLVGELAGSGVHLPRTELEVGAVPLFFPVWAKDKFGACARLKADGIDAVPVWGVHHDHVPRGLFPEMELLTRHLIEVPVHQTLAPRHLRRIRDGLVKHARWRGFAARSAKGALVGA